MITAKCALYLKLGKPEVWSHLANEDDHTIVATYGASTGGLVVERRWGFRRWGRFAGIVGADGCWCVLVTVWCWWAAAPCR
jgi:hypothetical protein